MNQACEKSSKPQEPMSAAILCCVFLSYLGLSLPFPIFSGMLLSEDSLFLQGPIYGEYRSVFFGIVLGIYPLGQSIGTILMGRLSDLYGRKKILILSLMINLISYLLCTLAVINYAYLLLVIGRFISGFSDSSCGIAQSIAADKLGKNCKIRQFGNINAAISLGWVFGPTIGGILGGISLFGLPGHSTVFIVPAVFCLVMALVLWRTFEDSRITEPRAKKTLFIKVPLSTTLRLLLGMNFAIYFGFSCFQQYYPNLMIHNFDATELTIGYTYSFLSIVWVLAQYYLIHFIADRFERYQTFKFCAVLMGASICGCAFSGEGILVYFFLTGIGVAGAVGITYATSLISDNVDAATQGTILGINRSFQSFARTAPAMTAGVLAHFGAALPLLFGMLVCLSAFLLCARLQRHLVPDAPSLEDVI